MTATKVRYAALGFEPGPDIETGPFLLDQKTADAAGSFDRALVHRSPIEVTIRGGTDNSGDVLVTGEVNGQALTETFAFAGPGGAGPLTVKSVNIYDPGTFSYTTTGLDGEAAVPTMEIRVSDSVYLCNVTTESIEADQKFIKNESNIASRTPFKSKVGLYELGGDIEMIVEPAAGIGESLTAGMGDGTHTPKSGAQLEEALGTGVEAATTQPSSPPKQLQFIVNSITGSDDIEIEGTVNGVPASGELIAITGPGTYYSTKFYDSVVDYEAKGGISAIDYDVHQVDCYEHEHIICDTVPSFFVRKGIDSIIEREHQGLKAEKLTIGAKVNEFLMAKLSTKGRTEEDHPTAVPLTSNKAPFVFHQAVVTRDGTEYVLPMEFEVTVSNTFAEEGRLGSRFLAELEEEEAKVELTMKVRNKDNEDYQRFYGALGLLSPSDTPTPQDIEILLTSNELTYVGGDAFALKIEMPRTFVEKIPTSLDGRKAIQPTVTFYPEKDSSIDSPIRITLTDDVRAY